MAQFLKFPLSTREHTMSRILALIVSGLFVSSVAFAQTPAAAPAADSGCAAKAVSKTGKPLAGAAKASFIKKCEADTKAAAPAPAAAPAAAAPAAAPAPAANAAAPSCADKALDKNGKPLAGAAKAASIKKCEAAAKPAK